MKSAAPKTDRCLRASPTALITLALGVALGLALVACQPSAMTPDASGDAVRYVALGDSYTIGTSVDEGDRWPNQLVERLGGDLRLALVANLGVNGFTSQDVIDEQLPRLDALAPDFVTLLVGVNDVVQGVPADRYRENVALILDAILERLPPERVLVISTPDYTVTPQGASFGDPSRQSAGIRRNNAILAEAAADRGITFVDIYDISLDAADERSLVAVDGLHPSGAQYSRWVDRIAPEVADLLAGM